MLPMKMKREQPQLFPCFLDFINYDFKIKQTILPPKEEEIEFSKKEIKKITKEAIKEFDCEVVGVGCIVDRTQGKMDDKFKIYSLLQSSPVTYDPNDCPLCKQGVELVKPGSRVGA